MLNAWFPSSYKCEETYYRVHTHFRIQIFDNCTKRSSECLHPYKQLGGPLLVHTLCICSNWRQNHVLCVYGNKHLHFTHPVVSYTSPAHNPPLPSLSNTPLALRLDLSVL